MMSVTSRPDGSFSIPILFALLITACSTVAQKKQLVRLAVIEVDTAQLDEYNAYLEEEIEASIRLEPGVITLYGISDASHPERVTLFETYADSSQYKAHLATPHFQKYKQGTLRMVRDLRLIATEPLLYHRKAHLENADHEKLFVRLIKMTVGSTHLDNFKKLAETSMLPGVKNEPGVLVMYAVAEKNNPGQVSVLEVYADSAAYENHLTTRHFQKYKADSKNMVSSLELMNVKPIRLGSKPQ